MENHPTDWLLAIEIFELASIENEIKLCNSIVKHLETVKQNRPNVGQLIDDGLEIVRTTKLLA